MHVPSRYIKPAAVAPPLATARQSAFRPTAPRGGVQRSARLASWAHTFDLSKRCQDAVWAGAAGTVVCAPAEGASPPPGVMRAFHRSVTRPGACSWPRRCSQGNEARNKGSGSAPTQQHQLPRRGSTRWLQGRCMLRQGPRSSSGPRRRHCAEGARARRGAGDSGGRSAHLLASVCWAHRD
jgi:hypothetical protein